MPPVGRGEVKRPISLPPELTSTGGLKVRNHLNAELTTKVRQFEDGIDYILTSREESEILLQSILGAPGSKDIEAFKFLNPSCSSGLFGLKLSRDQIYLVCITYLKCLKIDLNGLTNICANALNTWFENTYKMRLDLDDERIKYINEIKISNNELTVDSTPYNLEQARVHVKLAKFNEEYWLKARCMNTKKYIKESDELRRTGEGFRQCENMQYLFAADMGEIVNGSNTAYDRNIARKRMLDERIIVKESVSQNNTLERDTLCSESFQQRFDTIVINSSKFELYKPYHEFYERYFVLQQVPPTGDNGYTDTIINNVKEIAQNVIRCIQVLLENPLLKYMYIISRSYHHTIALIPNDVGNLIKVRVYDSVSFMYCVTFYVHPQDIKNPKRLWEVGVCLVNLPHFKGLVANKISMSFGNFTCMVPGVLSKLVSKKYKNNSLDIALNKLGSCLSVYAVPLIFFTLTACDLKVAEEIFSRNISVYDLSDEYFRIEGNTSDVVGLFVLQDVPNLLEILLNKWNREYIDQGINKIITIKEVYRNPVDCAMHLNNLLMAELLIKHGGEPAKFTKDGVILPEFQKLSNDVLQLLIQKNSSELLEFNKTKKGNFNTIMENFFKLQFFVNKFRSPQPIGAVAS